MSNAVNDLATANKTDKIEQIGPAQQAANDSAPIAKDVEQGPAQSDALVEDTEATQRQRFVSKIKPVHLALIFTAVIVLSIVSAVAYLKSEPPLYYSLTNEDVINNCRLADQFGLHCQYNSGTKYQNTCVYSFQNLNLIPEEGSDAIFSMPHIDVSVHERNDAQFWKDKLIDVGEVCHHLVFIVFTSLFQDIRNSAVNVDSSMFIQHLHSIPNMPDNTAQSVKAQIVALLTRNIPGYTKHLPFFVVAEYVIHNLPNLIVQLYWSVALVQNKYIKKIITTTDFQRNHLVFSKLPVGRLDGDVVTFVTKYVVEIALAMHHSQIPNIEASVNLAALFAGFNFSPIDGTAQCSNVKRWVSNVECAGDTVSFNTLLLACKDNDVCRDYNQHSIRLLIFPAEPLP